MILIHPLIMKNFLFALLITPTLALAQNDLKATSILNDMGRINNAYSSIIADFEYTLNNQAAGVNDTRMGSVVLSKGTFALDLGDYKVNSDGLVVWVTMTDLNEIQLYDYQEFKADNDFDPSEIFSGYSKGFKAQYKEEAEIKKVKVDVVDLFPEDPSKRNFSRIRLSIEQNSKHLKQAMVFGKDGNIYTYSVNTFKVDEDVANRIGKFDQAKFEKAGFTVEDLR